MTPEDKARALAARARGDKVGFVYVYYYSVLSDWGFIFFSGYDFLVVIAC
jgi:hypothetical protein